MPELIEGIILTNTGYLYAVQEFPTDHDPDSGVSVLHYDAISAPVAGNSSYRFYLNSTADSVAEDDSDFGFLVTDITVGNTSNLYRGKAMFWTYFPDTNVALPELGAGADPYNVQFLDFGKDGKAFVYSQHDDSKAVAGKPGSETSVNLCKSYASWVGLVASELTSLQTVGLFAGKQGILSADLRCPGLLMGSRTTQRASVST